MAGKNVLLAITGRASSNVTAITNDANGNYSSGGLPQGVCVMQDVSDGNFLSVTWATTGKMILGVADTAPAAGTGQSVAVQTHGIARIKAHGSITIGDLVYVGATDGTISTVPADGATSTYIVGTALEGATEAGDFISVLLQPCSQEIAS